MERLSDNNGIIGALAIDQRGSIKKMIGAHSEVEMQIEKLKNLNH